MRGQGELGSEMNQLLNRIALEASLNTKTALVFSQLFGFDPRTRLDDNLDRINASRTSTRSCQTECEPQHLCSNFNSISSFQRAFKILTKQSFPEYVKSME